MTKITIGETEIEDAEAFLKAHEKLKADIKNLREENKALQKAVENTDEEAVAKWKARSIRSEALAALQNTGVKDAERVLKRIDLSKVDFDDKGELQGLDESVNEFKNDFPELFDKKQRAGSADIHKDGEVDTPKTTSQLQAKALLG